MIKNLFIIILFSSMVHANQAIVFSHQTKVIDGILYVVEKEELFTGKIVDYFSNGKVMIELNFINGKQNGIYRRYYENGSLRTEVNYKDDSYHGELKEYHTNGTIARKSQYRNGKKVGTVKVYGMTGGLESEYEAKPKKWRKK